MSKFDLEIDGKLKSTTEGNPDWYYGEGGIGYDSLASARAKVPSSLRSGKTVGIIESGKVVEYIWHPEDVTDNGLVLKKPPLSDSVTSTDSTTGASSKAVKIVNDKVNTKASQQDFDNPTISGTIDTDAWKEELGISDFAEKGGFNGNLNDLKTLIDNLTFLDKDIPPFLVDNQLSDGINDAIRFTFKGGATIDLDATLFLNLNTFKQALKKVTGTDKVIEFVNVDGSKDELNLQEWFEDLTIADIIGLQSALASTITDIDANIIQLSGFEIELIRALGTNTRVDLEPLFNLFKNLTDLIVADANGIQQYKLNLFTEKLKLAGFTFNNATKTLSTSPLAAFTHFVDNTISLSSVGQVGNLDKPFPSIDSIFSLYNSGDNAQIIIVPLKPGVYEIQDKIPENHIEIRSNLDVTIDVSNLTATNSNTDSLFQSYSNGNLTDKSSFYLNIPNGTFLNDPVNVGQLIDEGATISQTQLNLRLNIKNFIHKSKKYSMYINSLYIDKIDVFETQGKIHLNPINPIKSFKAQKLILNSTISNKLEGVQGVIEVNELEVNTNDNIFSDKQTWLIKDKITGTGTLQFTYHSGSTVLNFLNTDIQIDFAFNQTIGNLTLAGIIKNINLTSRFSSGVLNLNNLFIENQTGSFRLYSSGQIIVNNTTVNCNTVFIKKDDLSNNATATVEIKNSTIKQATPTNLIEVQNGDGTINLLAIGLHTNATNLGDEDTNVTLIKTESNYLEYEEVTVSRNFLPSDNGKCLVINATNIDLTIPSTGLQDDFNCTITSTIGNNGTIILGTGVTADNTSLTISGQETKSIGRMGTTYIIR